MYIETSSPRVNGDKAMLQLKDIMLSGNTCLKFWYHMYGRGVSSLDVKVKGNTVFAMSGQQGNDWRLAVVRIAAKGSSTVSISHPLILRKRYDLDVCTTEF